MLPHDYEERFNYLKEPEKSRAIAASDIAIDIVNNVAWPWTDREKRLWYIGVLAGMVLMDSLEAASMEHLQEWHREITK